MSINYIHVLSLSLYPTLFYEIGYMIKILICDDHQLVIDGLQLMLHQVPDMVCLWRAGR